jgi:phosphatidylserine decarboxylase
LTAQAWSAYDEWLISEQFEALPVSVTTFAAAQLLRVLPRVQISRAVGRLCEKSLPAPVSRAIADAYCRAYSVDMDEVEPLDGAYPSFDAFFTRALRKGVRSVSEDAVVSPADGLLSAVGAIERGARIVVKGRGYQVAELTGDEADAARYEGGSFGIVYLSPRDYHRVHSPVDGKIGIVRATPGDLFPVNSIGERHVPRLLVRNNRVTICVDTVGLGRVGVVMVGAMIVGRISVTAIGDQAPRPGTIRIEPPREVRRGDEIGMFHLGSTVVLLFEPGIALQRGVGSVRYGQTLLRPS